MKAAWIAVNAESAVSPAPVPTGTLLFCSAVVSVARSPAVSCEGSVRVPDEVADLGDVGELVVQLRHRQTRERVVDARDDVDREGARRGKHDVDRRAARHGGAGSDRSG